MSGGGAARTPCVAMRRDSTGAITYKHGNLGVTRGTPGLDFTGGCLNGGAGRSGKATRTESRGQLWLPAAFLCVAVP
jgi:hypothetical protein